MFSLPAWQDARSWSVATFGHSIGESDRARPPSCRRTCRYREAAEDERADTLEGIVDLGIAPLGRVRRVVVVTRRVKRSTRCGPRVIGGEDAIRDAVLDDPGELADERIDVCCRRLLGPSAVSSM